MGNNKQEKKRQIKLTVTDEMFEAIKERAERMSISMPSLCCYFIGEKLDQLRLAEQTSVDALKDMAVKYFQSDDDDND